MVRGLRGATTVPVNEKEEVLKATRELLVALSKANAIKPADIAAVIFSSTPDVNAAFPAAAARELGWNDVPLFGTQEIDCPTGIPLCIRVLLLLNTDKAQHELQPVYLEGAVQLRPDIAAEQKR